MDIKENKTYINMAVGVVSQIVILILGLIIPRIILINYGSDTNGLINTINQIFTYLALLEAGISVSARNAFYKPIKENEREQISFIASLAKRYYRKVSIIYFFAVVVLSLGLPLTLKSSIEYSTICLYVFFEGLTSIVTFYFINTWTTLLQANGDSYVINFFTLISKILCYGIKIILSINKCNIVYIQVGFFVLSLFQLLLYKRYMKKNFGWVDYSIDTGETRLPDKNANLISEIAYVVFSSTDMIVLSIMVSTKVSSVYSVYNMVYMAISILLNTLYQSINYHLGLEFNGGDKERYLQLHDAYNSIFVGAITALVSICCFIILPFVRLYTNGINDADYLIKRMPILFGLVQILSWSRYVSGNLIGISFRQKPAVKINIIEAITNIILSIILVRVKGIEGVLFATVVALPLKVIYCTYISDIVILRRRPWKTISILGINYLFFSACAFISSFFSINIDNYFKLILTGTIIAAILIPACTGLNILANRDVLKLIKKKTEYSEL